MNEDVLTVIDIQEQIKNVDGAYANFPVTVVNDHVIRISVMNEPYFWHSHPGSDESFMVVEGCLLIELEGQTIELLPGQFFTIPKDVIHRTRPKGGRSVNITFERKDIETKKVILPGTIQE